MKMCTKGVLGLQISKIAGKRRHFNASRPKLEIKDGTNGRHGMEKPCVRFFVSAGQV